MAAERERGSAKLGGRDWVRTLGEACTQVWHSPPDEVRKLADLRDEVQHGDKVRKLADLDHEVQAAHSVREQRRPRPRGAGRPQRP